MQTFLPYPDFEESARVLDNPRLGKQRAEAIQVYRAMHIPGYGWRNHPVVRMWRGYDEALICYGVVVCREWRRRGFKDTVEATLVGHLGREPRSQAELRKAGALPPWLGNPELHTSHRSALLRKDPGWYRGFFGDGVPPDLPYYWPGGTEADVASSPSRDGA